MIISVIGGSKAKPEHLALAEEVGQELGKRNVMVACGGLHGVMEAVCRGAKSAGGTTIGILPGRTSKDANNYVDIPIVTTMGFSRNVIVVNTLVMNKKQTPVLIVVKNRKLLNYVCQL